MPEPCWSVLRWHRGAPTYNMALDEALLEAMPRLQKPVLRFYGWAEPAATFGYFQRIAQIERLTLLRPLVRRPTAGGLVPHDADWTYSLVFPAGSAWYALTAIESYQRVHRWIEKAFGRLGVATELAASARRAEPGHCFAGHERYDVLWQGRKIAGAAQRRTRDGLLILGSIQPPPLALSREDWANAMRQVASSERVQWADLRPDHALCERAAELDEKKYRSAAYNRKR